MTVTSLRAPVKPIASLFVAGGVAWTLGVTLVATAAGTDPVGVDYDALNRAFTLALLLVVTGAWTIAAGLAATRAHVAGRAIFAGATLMLVGNVLEFWGALASGEPTQASAERLGESEAFWGSGPGFGLFVAGSLILLAGCLAVAVRTRSTTPWTTRLPVAAVGPLVVASTALWALSPAAAAVAGGLFALAWLRLGQMAAGAR